jgi:aspartate aminotransferase-like enzyme
MPTDAIRAFDEIAEQQKSIGLEKLADAQYSMGWKARGMLESKGLVSVAEAPYQAPGVAVFYSPDGIDNPSMVKRFHQTGMQIAAGVPWRINEPEGLKTFRIGLFGIDKLTNVDKTVKALEDGIDYVMSDEAAKEAA